MTEFNRIVPAPALSKLSEPPLVKLAASPKGDETIKSGESPVCATVKVLVPTALMVRLMLLPVALVLVEMMVEWLLPPTVTSPFK